ncbi:MAG: GatB/YqeY domain-containing protein [Candidatus Tectomicrobia bacterium]|uniref:GatB/YqeY domain-containing protein n=1 Tax=Tectimicrobiota bacterium TaxID=2528274 RepID=A0A932HXT0_UNCTE|nr:GatB/YqeY domain-containing protein [Candidatus Tectomicrobia bacterium]
MAGIRERLAEDMKAAMREKNELRLGTVRMIRSEILNKDKEHGVEAGEEDILKVLQGMVKKREEAAEQFEKGGRPELARKERAEAVIVQSYLPVQVSDDELRAAARTAIAETGASTMKDMGKVMGVLSKRLSGRAAGGRISQAVKELLGG